MKESYMSSSVSTEKPYMANFSKQVSEFMKVSKAINKYSDDDDDEDEEDEEGKDNEDEDDDSDEEEDSSLSKSAGDG